MTDHPCIHESELAQLNYVCSKVIPEMKETLEKIFEKLEGNGKPGLMTDVALLKQRHETMPSVRMLVFYASVGGGCIMGAGFLGTVVLKSLGWL